MLRNKGWRRKPPPLFTEDSWPEDLQHRESYEKDAENPCDEEIVALTWGDGCLQPKEIARSRKLSFVHMAAASRHSAATSALGDLYVWGECQIDSERQANFRKLGRTTIYQYPAAVAEKCSIFRELCITQAAVTRNETYGVESCASDQIYEESLVESLRSLACCRHASRIREQIATKRRKNLGRVVAMRNKCLEIFSPKLMHVRTLATGREHCLALTENGQVYSWGKGRDGRLGLGDYLDRWEPVPIEFLEPVSLIAAGQSHSAAVMNSEYLYTWGRGARGRLGTDRHLNKNTPQPVKISTTSNFIALALGGAHSLALLANGELFAWGAGGCGQLGNDCLVDSARPLRVKLPKWANDAQAITAGKSHSLCLTRSGRIYVWGKNSRGELGTGDTRFRIAPSIINASSKYCFTHIAAGDSHTLALAKVVGTRSSKKTSPSFALIAEKKNNAVVLKLASPPRCHCARLSSLPLQSNTFRCVTCGIVRVCQWCAKRCHYGHRLLIRDTLHFEQGINRNWCDCGLSSSCSLLVAIDEEPFEKSAFVHSLCIVQNAARIWLARQRVKNRLAELAAMNRSLAENVWQSQVLDIVWSKVHAVNNAKHVSYETKSMALADAESKEARRYLQLQLALQSLDIQMQVIIRLCACSGAPDPHPNGNLLRFRSIPALRQWHRRHPRHERQSALSLARWGQMYGLCSIADSRLEVGRVADPDVSTLANMARFSAMSKIDLESAKPLRRRHSIAAPENMFNRLRDSLALGQRQQLRMKRRLSLDPKARENKSHFRKTSNRSATELVYDINEAEILSRYQNGIQDSLDVARRALLSPSLSQWETTKDTLKVQNLSSADRLLSALAPFSTLFHRPSLTPAPIDIRPITNRRALIYRSASVAAPERMTSHMKLWMRKANYTRMQQKKPTKFRCIYALKHRGGTIYHRERIYTYSNSDDGAGTPSSAYLDLDPDAFQPRLDRHEWIEQSRALESSSPNLPTFANAIGARASSATVFTGEEVCPEEATTTLDDNAPAQVFSYGQEENDELIIYDAQGQPWQPCYHQGNRYYYCEWTGESSWYPWSSTIHVEDSGDYENSEYYYHQSGISSVTPDEQQPSIFAQEESSAAITVVTTADGKKSSSSSSSRLKKKKKKSTSPSTLLHQHQKQRKKSSC